jgi:LCP family protein required for cell wall assembly
MAARERAEDRHHRRRRSVANDAGLASLGDTVTKKKNHRRGSRVVAWGSVVLALVLVAGVVGGYLYFRYDVFDDIGKFSAKGLHQRAGNDPFNVLIIGSDSRAGLTGSLGRQTGAGTVSGQRSDAIKILHINPDNHTITMISIPRDTLVKLLANQDLYTNYNRINVNYGAGPSLLVETIEANFGIPINHVVQVSFSGLINAADALGGVWLNFPYPAKDALSGLDIHHAGCQLVRGFQALALVRSRHYEYEQDGQWLYDGSSDFGRIQRQDTFIRAMMDAARGKVNVTNLIELNSFITRLSKGITIDSTWTFNELVQLAYDFQGFQSSSMKSYTLPVVSDGDVAPYGDVLSEEEPEAQQLLVQIFGHELMRVRDVPPNGDLEPVDIPNIPVPTSHVTSSTTTSTPNSTGNSGSSSGTHSGDTTVTTTTLVPSDYDYFNPVPCTPK